MAITLTVTNNQDGTATATCSGGNALASNAVKIAIWTGSHATSAFVTAITVPGNTSGTLSPGQNARYMAYVESTFGGSVTISNFVYFRITDVDDAAPVYYRILRAVQDQVAALVLDSIGSNVQLQKVAWDKDTGTGRSNAFPVCLVVPGASETVTSTVNQQDDIGYPVAIVFADADQQSQTLNYSRNLGWRETVSKAFRYQRLDGVDEVYQCVPDAGLSRVVDQLEWIKTHWVSVMGFRFITREDRGIT